MNPGSGFFVAAAVPMLAAGFIYARGAHRRAAISKPVGPLRQAAFAAGLAALFFSLEWPFATWAHALFFVHQIGIMVARIIAPMLIVLSHPAGLLIAGLPRGMHRALLRPGLSARSTRRAWRVIGHPITALILYVTTFYIWEIPAAQGLAIAYPAAGLTMHLSLLLSGLLFWSRIFERRPAPHGTTHGQRLMMIWLAMLTQIPLGAYLTVKSTVLYTAYAAGERAAMIAPLVDEERGGGFVWVPSALLCLLALLVVVDMWGRHETRMDQKRRRWSPSNSAILLYPETATALRSMTAAKNRRLAFGMAGFALLIFSAVCGVAMGAHRINRRDNIRLYNLSRG